MSSLGRLVRKHAADMLATMGFARTGKDRTLYRRQTGERIQFIEFDRAKGGDLRVFLSVDCDPTLWGEASGIRAESPWWDAAEESELEPSVTQAVGFLVAVGFRWLTDPYALSPTEWRAKHKILVHDLHVSNLNIERPPDLPVNKAALLLKQHVQQYKGTSAMVIREGLLASSKVALGAFPHADALELAATLEREGFIVSVVRTDP